MYNTAIVSSVSYQARAICSQRASADAHRFLVGTCSLHDSNELNVFQYSEDAHHFETVITCSHEDQILAIESSPKDTSLIATSRLAKNKNRSVTIWKMHNQSIEEISDGYPSSGQTVAVYNDERVELKDVATFSQTQSLTSVNSIKWHSSQGLLVTADSKKCSVWNIEDGEVQCEGSVSFAPSKPQQQPLLSSSDIVGGSVAWDPHSEQSFAAVFDTTLQLVDIREMDITAKKVNAHDDTIRDVDFNPNKPLMLLTTGHDRKIKFWDMRNMRRAVRVLDRGHSHWICSARFNPFHDQLVLSGGSDNIVNLWRVASCSSAPWLGSEDKSASSYDPPDVKVRAIDQHEDSVYGVAWSPADAWIYCSLSFDGRVILNHVPSTEKYKILL